MKKFTRLTCRDWLLLVLALGLTLGCFEAVFRSRRALEKAERLQNYLPYLDTQLKRLHDLGR